MRVTPPYPGFSSPLLAAVVKLSFFLISRDASGELGVLVDENGTLQHLTVQSGGRDGTWTLVTSLPEDCGHFLLSRETFELIQKGTLSEDGTIDVDGQRYYLRAAMNGGRMTAKTIRVEMNDG